MKIKTKQSKTKIILAKTILSNKRTLGGISIPIFKLYNRRIVGKLPDIGTETDTNKWNGFEDSEIEPQTFAHLIVFYKEAQTL